MASGHWNRAAGYEQADAMKKVETKVDDMKPSFAQTLSHPKKIGYCGTFFGSILGSFLFIGILNLGTGFNSLTCTIEADGTASGNCSWTPSGLPNAAQVGTHPDFMANNIALVMVVFGANYVSRHVAGLWSLGNIDLLFTLTDMMKSLVTKEPLKLGHRLLSMAGQVIGAVLAIFLVYIAMGNRDSYASGGEGLGGPGITVRGRESITRTIFLAIFASYVRVLLYFMSTVYRSWATETGNKNNLNEDGELKKLKRDHDMDHLSTGVTHHAWVTMLSVTDAVIAVTLGSFIGPALGYIWRDIGTLTFTRQPLAVDEAEEHGSLWFFPIFAMVGAVFAVASGFIVLWTIRSSEKKSEDDKHD